MRHSLARTVEELRLYWKNYLLQSIYATITIFILLLVLSPQRAVIIGSVGATAFIVFAMPKDFTAKPRHVIGGHVVGIVSGSLCALLPHTTILPSLAIYSLAVGCSIFLMVITDTEHPPASGTALGIAIKGFSYEVVAAVIISAIVLAAIRHVFKAHLRNLI
jgi:CBS-domain-containing membrane protein